MSSSLMERNIVIEKLQLKIVGLEKSLHGGLQHSRKSNIEIDGIPTNIGDERKQLEEAAIKILNAINVPCLPEDIEAIHRLPAKSGIKPTIIRFGSRRIAEDAFANKNKLKSLKELHIPIIGLNDDSKIFIRPSLCPYFRTLAYNCRLLRNSKLIQSVFTSDDGSIKIKTLDNSFNKISHETDLTSRFKDFQNFSF